MNTIVKYAMEKVSGRGADTLMSWITGLFARPTGKSTSMKQPTPGAAPSDAAAVYPDHVAGINHAVYHLPLLEQKTRAGQTLNPENAKQVAKNIFKRRKAKLSLSTPSQPLMARRPSGYTPVPIHLRKPPEPEPIMPRRPVSPLASIEWKKKP